MMVDALLIRTWGTIHSRLVADQSGATAVEYGVIVGLVAVIVVGVIGTLGGTLLGWLGGGDPTLTAP
jgi:pilus assembly protein Flp/PilA